MAKKAQKTRHPGVFLRPDSPFYWITYRTSDGRRHRESSQTTSVLQAAKIRAQRMSGIGLPGVRSKTTKKPKTLREFSEEYLEVQRHLKSFTTLEGRVRNLVEGIGDIPMNDLTARDYERYRAKRLGEKKRAPGQKTKPGGCKPGTVNRELTTLKHMLRKARSYGFISHEAVERISEVRKLKEENVLVRYLSKEDEEKLLRACIELGQKDPQHYGHLYPIVLTALRTGLRKGEILALRREDVNLDKRIIHVVKSKGGTRRDVPMPSDLAEVLRELLSGHCVEHVFWHGTGRAEVYKDVKLSFKRALRKAGITGFRFHDCRHHYASWFVMNGGNIVHLQKILGHASITMTMRYSHLAPDFIEAATRVLDGHAADTMVTFWSRSRGGRVKALEKAQ